VGTVRVEERGCAEVLCADQLGDAAEGELELFGLGHGREEQAVLDDAGVRGGGLKRNGEDGGARVVGLEVELEELEERFVAGHREREAESAGVGGAVVELEMEAELVGGEAVGVELGKEVLEKPG
jgi:hypothetical protein